MIALAVVATGGGVDIAVGPLAALAVERGEDGTALTFGPLLIVMPAVVGGANAAAAWLVTRRRGVE